MTVPRRARALVLVAVLLALPVLVLRASLKAPERLSALDRVVLRLSSPVQGAIAWLGRGVGGGWSRYVALWHVSDENVRLRDENARLQREVERLTHEAARVTALEALVKLREGMKAETLSARVIGAETSPFFRVVRLKLDQGELEVKPGMPVLAPAGVVGRVERTFGPYCDVLLATDPKSSIDVVVARTGARGILKGMPGQARYRARIDYLLRTDEAAPNDVLVTSGIGGFPRNLPVGRIVKVAHQDFGLYQEAEVEPAVDFSRLREVLVLLAPPPADARDERDGGEKASADR